MKKLFAILAVLGLVATLGGCAVQQYGNYSKAQAKMTKDHQKTQQEYLKALGKLAAHGDAQQKTMAGMAMFAYGLTNKAPKLEQAQPSPIEKGIGAAIPRLPGAAALYGVADAGFNAAAEGIRQAGGNTTINAQASGTQSGVVVSPGEGSTASAAPADDHHSVDDHGEVVAGE